jgi:hypothetical protein
MSRDIPRISVNKLAEYLEATSTRRKKIIYDAKYPASFIVTRYKDAKDSIETYIYNNESIDYLKTAKNIIKNKTTDTDFQENDRKLSIQLLEKLIDTDISIFKKYEITSNEEDNKLINISGVNISVNPDLLITQKIKNKLSYGAIKLQLTKNSTLTDEGQKVVAIMLYKYLTECSNYADSLASLNFRYPDPSYINLSLIYK